MYSFIYICQFYTSITCRIEDMADYIQEQMNIEVLTRGIQFTCAESQSRKRFYMVSVST